MEEKKNKNLKKIIIGIIATVVMTGILVCFAIAYNNIKNNNQSNTTISNNSSNASMENKGTTAKTSSNTENSKVVNITSGGSYDLSGEYESITINTSDEVTINLNGVEITNSNGPAINIEKAKKVTIVLIGTNKTLPNLRTEALDKSDNRNYHRQASRTLLTFLQTVNPECIL